MKIFIHCELDHIEKALYKVEWLLCDGKININYGEVKSDMPSYTYDFVLFLLALGNADHIVGYDLERKVKFIHNAMHQNNFSLTLKRPNSINRIDLHKYMPSMKKPDCVQRIFMSYFDNELLFNGVII